jgi:hypothetical protein
LPFAGFFGLLAPPSIDAGGGHSHAVLFPAQKVILKGKTPITPPGHQPNHPTFVPIVD